MKTIQIKITLLVLFAFGFMLTSCVNDDDFETPDVTVTEPNIGDGTVVGISSVLGILEQNDNNPTLIEDNIFVEGFVISSDEAGNFFEEIIIQDKAEDATAGLRISVNVNPLFSKYNFGRRVLIKMQGLHIGLSNGVATVGRRDDENRVSQIQENEIDEFILRTPEVATIVPNERTISQLGSADLNTYLRLTDVQFSATSLGKTFASEPADEFDGERLLEGCNDGETIIFNTSTFADYRTLQVPGGSGQIDGILSLNFFGDTPIFVINAPNDIAFSDSRCNIEDTLEPNITIPEVLAMYNGSVMEFPANQNLVTEGYVVSSDISGNFFKNIFIQDNPENPTAAIQILADENDLYQTYPPGTKVLIKLDKLALEDAFIGGFTLGFIDSFQGDLEVARIEEGRIGEFLFPTNESANIVPLTTEVTASGIVLEGTGTPAPTGTLIQVNNVQMPLSDVGSAYTFFSGTESVNRQIESCDTGSTTIMRNSGFADFANTAFPTGQGSITAVLGSFGDSDQLLIRTTNDVNLTGERCDPLIFECGTLASPAANSFVNVDFESSGTNQPVDIPGWTNYIEAGTETWETYTSGGTNASLGISARAGSFQSGDASSVAWLITPLIPISSNQTITLDFQNSNSFADDSKLDILFSSDWDGTEANIASAEWGVLADADVVSDSEFFGNWVSSGIVDLSCLGEDGYVAFRYTGSGQSSNDGTYEIDEIRINIE